MWLQSQVSPVSLIQVKSSIIPLFDMLTQPEGHKAEQPVEHDLGD